MLTVILRTIGSAFLILKGLMIKLETEDYMLLESGDKLIFNARD